MDADKQKYKDNLKTDVAGVRKEFDAATKKYGGEPDIWEVLERIAHARVWPLEGKKMDYYIIEGQMPAPKRTVPSAARTNGLRVIRWSPSVKKMEVAHEAAETIDAVIREELETFDGLTPGGLETIFARVAWAAYVQDLYDALPSSLLRYLQGR